MKRVPQDFEKAAKENKNGSYKVTSRQVNSCEKAERKPSSESREVNNCPGSK